MTAERKYPIGIQTFERVVRGGYLYVDKTDLVWQLAHYAPFVFLSRLLHYRKGDDAAKLPYKLAEIHIGKGVMIGMESLIMHQRMGTVSWQKQYQLDREIQSGRVVCGPLHAMDRLASNLDYGNESDNPCRHQQ